MLEMAREEIPEEKKLELIFAKEQTAIKANDLQGFIFYFNMYYLKLIEDYSIRDLKRFINNENNIKKSFNFTNDDYYYYSKKLYTNNDLLIFEIEKHSPLKIIFGGSMIALTLAVILSGGTLEIDASKFKIKTTINKSLGESLQDLRRVLKENN
ncbi:hypothetical protein [Arcobacter sp. FWKO B]|uniref:hypothetical protein n=1 Tax=Arcobacter sp. FWKO B TaxID=2593672 RepID=UPI0018A4430C|nr:hypothetical protein [Arcobacter sp. FWKO B]QOG11249.1 hypothetical protein FWKOB_00445 [Arcobacter sp. FWKO B]